MDPLKEHTIAFSGLKDGEHTFTYKLGKEFFDAAGVEDFEGGDVAVKVSMCVVTIAMNPWTSL